jgi:hypothetical protein
LFWIKSDLPKKSTTTKQTSIGSNSVKVPVFTKNHVNIKLEAQFTQQALQQ